MSTCMTAASLASVSMFSVVLSAQGGDHHSQKLLPGLLDFRGEDTGAKLHSTAHSDAFSQELKKESDKQR